MTDYKVIKTYKTSDMKLTAALLASGHDLVDLIGHTPNG